MSATKARPESGGTINYDRQRSGVILKEKTAGLQIGGILVTVTDAPKFLLKPSRFPEVDAIREATLRELIDRLRELEGDNLLQVVLYGSVARGDAREDSDTDVFILLRDTNGDSMQNIIERIIDVTVDIDMYTGQCRTHITPDVVNLKEYNDKNRYEGFYINLKKDGVTLYDAV